MYVLARWDGTGDRYPLLVAMPPSIPAYHQTFRAQSNTIRTVDLELWLLSAPLDGGQIETAQLDALPICDWEGDQSVFAALLGDPTLGGVVGECKVRSLETLGAEEINLVKAWGAKFMLTINLVPEAP